MYRKIRKDSNVRKKNLHKQVRTEANTTRKNLDSRTSSAQTWDMKQLKAHKKPCCKRKSLGNHIKRLSELGNRVTPQELN